MGDLRFYPKNLSVQVGDTISFKIVTSMKGNNTYDNNKKYDSRFTVTFNKKDYENYSKNYPECDIYWCINWTQLKYNNTVIKGLDGVWLAKFSDMAKKIESCDIYLHKYVHRKDYLYF